LLAAGGLKAAELAAVSRKSAELLRQRVPFFSDGMSSTSASESPSRWPRFGPVPLGRCPACPRTASLQRRVTASDKNGNRGREYVKCESKEQLGEVRSVFPLSISFFSLNFQPIWVFIRFGFSYLQDLLPCDHFEWLEDYIKRIQKEDKKKVPNLLPVVEQLGSATVHNGVQKDEFKKMAKQMETLVGLKKQSNMMAAFFYLCAIVLGIVYLKIISQK
jgi:hypothetical protein